MNLLINLQLFADGGSASAGGDGAGVGVSAVSPTATESVESQSSPDTTNEVVDRKANYDKFKADYKAEYDAEVQGIVKDRLKKSNAKNSELSKRLETISPILQKVADKYGVDVNDTDALLNAFNDDDANYEDEAYEKGMTVEQVKAFHEIERENASLRKAEEERLAQAQYQEWDRQFDELAKTYPNVDKAKELESDEFKKLMNAGVSIRTIYEVMHKAELMNSALSQATRVASEKVTNSVIANKSRPTEAGLSNSSASISQTSIRNLSREQMEDYKRRARMGERIDFKS